MNALVLRTPPRGHRRARQRELVTRRDHVHPRAPSALDRGEVHRREHAELGGTEYGAAAEDLGPRSNVIARTSHVAAGRNGRAHQHSPALRLGGVLLAQDGVRPLRKRRPGRDPHRLARLQRRSRRRAGAGLAREVENHGILRGGGRGVERAHRIAVHRGVVDRRHRRGGVRLLGQHPLERLAERNRLRLERPDLGQDHRPRHVEGDRWWAGHHTLIHRGRDRPVLKATRSRCSLRERCAACHRSGPRRRGREPYGRRQARPDRRWPGADRAAPGGARLGGAGQRRGGEGRFPAAAARRAALGRARRAAAPTVRDRHRAGASARADRGARLRHAVRAPCADRTARWNGGERRRPSGGRNTPAPRGALRARGARGARRCAGGACAAAGRGRRARPADPHRGRAAALRRHPANVRQSERSGGPGASGDS